ncbi:MULTISPECIES: hypothetical protein [unclassified Luteibacter]|uniref:hypothetical protein n=1 Tax=Luteibacter sp. PvP019 TaxID=3156436 RepID=UPI00339A6480
MESVTFPTNEPGAAHTDCILPNVDPTPELLTFESLNQRLSTMPDYDAPTQSSRQWSRIAITIAALSYLAALGIPRLPIDGGTQAILLLAFLVVEVVGLTMSMWMTRGEFRTMFRPMEELSKQLDHDFDYHFSLRTWLMEQPEDRLRKYASMAAFRRERYAQKLPMLAGAIPTLGIIPVLVAIYFQGRQLLEGGHLSVVDWLFGFALLLFYVLTWTSSIAKSRLDAIDMHLQGALNELEKKIQPDATSPWVAAP